MEQTVCLAFGLLLAYLSILDHITTSLAMERGLVEANPLASRLPWTVKATIAFAIGSVSGCIEPLVPMLLSLAYALAVSRNVAGL